MFIGIDIRSLMSGPFSGVGVYTYQLLRHLFAIDQSNDYFLFYNSRRSVEQELPKFISPHVFPRGFRYPNKILNFSLAFFGYPYLDRLMSDVVSTSVSSHGKTTTRREIDVFFTPNWLFTALSPKVKKILNIHDLAPFRFPEFFSKKQWLWHRFLRVKKLIRETDTIICVSEHTRQDLIEFFHVPFEKTVVIHEGVAQEYFITATNTHRQKVQEKYHLPEQFMLTMSNIEPRKNILGIIESFEIFQKISPNSDLHLVIAGGSPWQNRYAKQVKQRAGTSPVSQLIHLIGYVDPNDQTTLLQLARLFLFPSFYEGFGLPILESMASGVPVIASNVSSIPEIVENAAPLVDPYNLHDLAYTMFELLNNNTLYTLYRERGAAQAQKFRWGDTAEKTIQCFQKS